MTTSSTARGQRLRVLGPGLLAAALVAAVAEAAAPVAGIPPVVLAIALGALAGNLAPPQARRTLNPGLGVYTKLVLKAAIVLLGLKLTADRARDLAGPVLVLIGLCLVLALLGTRLLSKPFGVSRRVALLLGCGTGICGATAVVTVAPLVDAKEDEVAFSIATIFVFNVAALFAFPAIGRAAGLDDLQFGAWVGTAVNDTSAVVATGQAFSDGGRVYATAIKLVRTLALVPLALGVAATSSHWRQDDAAAPGDAPATRKKVSLASVFPWFVVGFAAVAALSNLVALPREVTAPLLRAASLGITAVLAAVGLRLDARSILGSGARSLGLGFAIATVMAGASYALIRLLGIAAA